MRGCGSGSPREGSAGMYTQNIDWALRGVKERTARVAISYDF